MSDCHTSYHTSVHKTTVYLPDGLKAAVTRVAAQLRRSEAEVIREAIATYTSSVRPRPAGALFASDDGGLSEQVDTALAGFGDR